MLKSKSLLSFDFGAGTLKVAEFEVLPEANSLRLKQFATQSMGIEGSQDAVREAVLVKGIQSLLAQKGFGSKVINVCAPGFHVFSKFVKLPPVDSSKVTQIIQYEAQQNVPFPLAEVVWDYQILGTTGTGELEVLLVAIKADIVEGLFRTAEATGLRLQLVDVSPAALCNAFRYNYGDLEGCTMLLDIGAKTSNLLFFEKGKVYSRSINIGANSITQDFATEAKIRFPEAEQQKIELGFVSLGGAYEEPDNPRQAQISKIARNVMTRLHIQVNQTMQFYRGQQGGSAPQRLFLAGGAAIMPYTAQFFAEKLNVAVEYFNPFRNLQIDPAVNLEELAKVAHSFGEVVGLGLRSLAQCPVELNLMPKSILKRQQFNQKKPYLIASVFSLVAVVFAYAWFFSKAASIRGDALQKMTERANPINEKKKSLEAELAKLNKAQAKANRVGGWLRERLAWVDILAELQRVLKQTETVVTASSGGPVGVWIETLSPDTPEALAGATPAAPAPGTPTPGTAPPTVSRELAERYGLKIARETGQAVPAASSRASTVVSTNEIANIRINCRAINLKPRKPAGNEDLAFALEKELKACRLFEEKETKLTGQLEQVDASAITFGFEVTLRLKTPIKL